MNARVNAKMEKNFVRMCLKYFTHQPTTLAATQPTSTRPNKRVLNSYRPKLKTKKSPSLLKIKVWVLSPFRLTTTAAFQNLEANTPNRSKALEGRIQRKLLKLKKRKQNKRI